MLCDYLPVLDMVSSTPAHVYVFSSKICVPHLRQGTNPHILNLSPPLNLNPKWFKGHVGQCLAVSMG